MFKNIYEEIKHPYAKKNWSYKIFRYACEQLVIYYIVSYLYSIIAFGHKLNGNIDKFIQVLEFQGKLNLFIGTIMLICFMISIFFRKKI